MKIHPKAQTNSIRNGIYGVTPFQLIFYLKGNK